MGDNSEAHSESYADGLDTAKQALASMADEIDQFGDDISAPTRDTQACGTGTNVFIIHGHNIDFAETVARFVEKRGLTAVILHEKPNMGRTIIEKFEHHALPCAFAIAIFAGDDEGRLKGSADDLRARARQNVVLELGYFMGALGRDRVAVLYQPEVELPSDYDGVLYVPLSPDWRSRLDTEFDAANLGKRTTVGVGTP